MGHGSSMTWLIHDIMITQMVTDKLPCDELRAGYSIGLSSICKIQLLWQNLAFSDGLGECRCGKQAIEN